MKIVNYKGENTSIKIEKKEKNLKKQSETKN